MSEHRQRLEDLRDRLEAAIADASENMLPQLSGQYQNCLDRLHALDAAKPQAGIQDDLKDRRRQRREHQRRKA